MKLSSSSIPFLIMIITIQATSAQNFINSTCQTLSQNDPNIEYAFCSSSLQAAPASGCATLRGLGIISIRLLRDNITDTRCQIKELMKDSAWDRYKLCLSDCFQLFSDAIPATKQAMRYYSMKKFDDANVQISSIMDASSTCEDGFNERGGPIFPLTKRNNDAFQLGAVVLSIMHIIQTGSG